jgi:hypothetical protein
MDLAHITRYKPEAEAQFHMSRGAYIQTSPPPLFAPLVSPRWSPMRCVCVCVCSFLIEKNKIQWLTKHDATANNYRPQAQSQSVIHFQTKFPRANIGLLIPRIIFTFSMLQSSFVTQTTAATSAAAPVHNTMDLIAHINTDIQRAHTHVRTDRQIRTHNAHTRTVTKPLWSPCRTFSIALLREFSALSWSSFL